MTQETMPEVAIDLSEEEEGRPVVVDITSSTDGEHVKGKPVEVKINKNRKEWNAQNTASGSIPIVGSAKWELEKKPKPPTRVIERTREYPRRGTALITSKSIRNPTKSKIQKLVICTSFSIVKLYLTSLF